MKGTSSPIETEISAGLFRFRRRFPTDGPVWSRHACRLKRSNNGAFCAPFDSVRRPKRHVNFQKMRGIDLERKLTGRTARRRQVVEEARTLYGGNWDAQVQKFMLEDCVEDRICGCALDQEYVGRVLKESILAAEREGVQVLDEMYHRHAETLVPHDDGQLDRSQWIHKTYAYGPREHNFRDREQYQYITLRLSRDMFHGSTGCHEWEAGFYLAEFLMNRPDIVEGKKLMEIGSGSGVSGIVAARLDPQELVLTDGDLDTVDNLLDNLERNGIATSGTLAGTGGVCKVQCVRMSWEAFANHPVSKMCPHVILGADLLYDPGVIPSLVDLLKRGLSSRVGCVAYIATALRNESTLDAFLSASESHGLRIVDCTPVHSHPPVGFQHLKILDRSRLRLHALRLPTT